MEVVVEGTWLLGGDGFGTERARLVGDALGTERARLAQGGFRGQFSKRNPFKRFSENTKNFAKFSYGGSDTFGYKIQKIQIPIRNFFFLGSTLQLVENIKPIR